MLMFKIYFRVTITYKYNLNQNIYQTLPKSILIYPFEAEIKRLKTASNVISAYRVNPLTAKLFNMNFHPLEIVSR